MNPSFEALPLKIGAAWEEKQMDSCPLAFRIWHTAVRPGRSPGRRKEQMEHPPQRRLQAEDETGPQQRLWVPGSPRLPSAARVPDAQRGQKSHR